MSDATVSARVRGARRCSRTGWLHGTPVPQWSWSIPRSEEIPEHDSELRGV